MPRLPNQRYQRLVKKIEQGNQASNELEKLFAKHLGENYDCNELAGTGCTTFDTLFLPSSFAEALEYFTE